MDGISYETYDELLNSPLKPQIPDELDLPRQYDFFKRTIDRWVSLRTVPYISECEAYYFLDGGGDAWHVWPADTPVEQIVSELEQNGWECSVETRGDEIIIECAYPEGEETLFQMFSELYSNRSKYRIVDKLNVSDLPYMYAANPEPELPGAEFGYIRFGDLPADGISINHLLDAPEEGISCFHAEITANGDYQFTQMTPMLCEDVIAFFEENNRPLYRLYGELVGHGSDGEPLLKVTKTEKITGKYIGKPLEVVREEALRKAFPLYRY